MAKMVNVNREVQDPFYRYKMPLLTTKIEGRGNGIKTVIPNMAEVAKSLARPPAYPTKFFGCELGAQTQMKDDTERYIVNGSHETERFQELLDEFIIKYVLCPQCTNPETVLRVTSKKQIEQKCKACGYIGFIPLIHRVTAFIINNPPQGSSKSKKSKTQQERRAEKAEKSGKKSSSVSDDGGDSVSRDTSNNDSSLGQIGAQVDAAKVRLGGNVAAPDAVTGKEDDDWCVDLSEDAVRARTEALGTGVSSLTQTDDLEKTVEQRLEIFEKYVIARLGLPKFPAKEVVGEADRLDCKEKGVMIIMNHIFGKADFLPTIKKNQGLLQRFTIEAPKTQRYLLGALEKIIHAREAELLPKAAKIIKSMYDLDILDEEVIIAWDDKVSKKYVPVKFAQQIRDKIKPVVDWLKEAESEDSDEEEDDLFVQDPEAVLAAEQEAVSVASKSDEEEDDEDEDIDLDDI
eukprot:m.21245 g.21245  ORF g.21245 m.21245 type:complete len:460 (+) comp13317_c0_seq1:374-1753(+)